MAFDSIICMDANDLSYTLKWAFCLLSLPSVSFVPIETYVTIINALKLYPTFLANT